MQSLKRQMFIHPLSDQSRELPITRIIETVENDQRPAKRMKID